MISEVAVVSAELAKEAAKETAKEVGKEVADKAVDVGKRIDVSKQVQSQDIGKVDISKRIVPEVVGEIGKTDISKLAKEYIDDLKTKAVSGEAIFEKAFDISKLELQSPEQVAEMRENFDDNKAKLRKEWEVLNNREWPKYTQDVYNDNGIRIRKIGDNYDAHHIQPLQLGGENVASNLTPMDLSKHAEIHSKDGSCSKLVKAIEGVGK